MLAFECCRKEIDLNIDSQDIESSLYGMGMIHCVLKSSIQKYRYIATTVAAGVLWARERPKDPSRRSFTLKATNM